MFLLVSIKKWNYNMIQSSYKNIYFNVQEFWSSQNSIKFVWFWCSHITNSLRSMMPGWSQEFKVLLMSLVQTFTSSFCRLLNFLVQTSYPWALMQYTRDPRCSTLRPASSHPLKNSASSSLPILRRQLIKNAGHGNPSSFPATNEAETSFQETSHCYTSLQ